VCVCVRVRVRVGVRVRVYVSLKLWSYINQMMNVLNLHRSASLGFLSMYVYVFYLRVGS